MATKTKKTQLIDHGFPPGTKVTAHEEALESPRDDKAPYSEALADAKVGKDGTLEFAGLKPGQYVAAGEIEVAPVAPEQEAEKTYRNVNFAVN